MKEEWPKDCAILANNVIVIPKALMDLLGWTSGDVCRWTFDLNDRERIVLERKS